MRDRTLSMAESGCQTRPFGEPLNPGSLTVLGETGQTWRFPWGKPWDRQPVSGKVRRKLGVSPGFAAYRGPPPPKRPSAPEPAVKLKVHAAHPVPCTTLRRRVASRHGAGTFLFQSRQVGQPRLGRREHRSECARFAGLATFRLSLG